MERNDEKSISEWNDFKTDTGEKIRKFREMYISDNRTKCAESIDYSPSILQNVERGRNGPNTALLIRMAEYTGRFVWQIFNEGYHVNVNLTDSIILSGNTDSIKVRILMRVICDRFDMLQIYDERMINRILRPEDKPDRNSIGYMIKFERTRKGVSRSKLSKQLGITLERLRDMESGCSAISFRNMFSICRILDIPIDILLIRAIHNKENIVKYLEQELYANVTEKERMYIHMYIGALKYKWNCK